MIEIIPAILATTKEEFDQMVLKIKPFVSMVQIDVSDGVFTKTKFVGPEIVSTMPADLGIDLHLMVKNPEAVLPAWLSLPQVKRITFHIEATDKTQKIIDTVHNVGRKVGIALNPETETEKIEPFLNKIDLVLFMAVHPGQYGAEFQPAVLDKIAAFHTKYPEVVIAIDGGTSPERVQAMMKAGVSIFISGGYIMNSENPDKAISELKKAIQ